jgi:hypothetical protein
MTARVLAMTVMLAVPGGRANAQELATDLNQLRVLVKPGDSLTVTETGGRQALGRLVQLDASAIVLEFPNKQRRQFDGSMIQTIEKRGGDSLKNGALIGLIAGGSMGIWGGISEAHYNEDMYGSSYSGAGAARMALGYGLLMGGLGAAVGTGIDALIRGRHVIYSKSPPVVTVAPLLDRQHQGLVVTLRN